MHVIPERIGILFQNSSSIICSEKTLFEVPNLIQNHTSAGRDRLRARAFALDAWQKHAFNVCNLSLRALRARTNAYSCIDPRRMHPHINIYTYIVHAHPILMHSLAASIILHACAQWPMCSTFTTRRRVCCYKTETTTCTSPQTPRRIKNRAGDKR